MDDLARNDATAVFDPSAVRSLTGHEHDRQIGMVVVGRFRRMLPERIRRIVGSLEDQDLDDAMDAVRSLKVASGTLGAGELAELGRRIEGHLRRGDVAEALAVAEELTAAADRARLAISAYLHS